MRLNLVSAAIVLATAVLLPAVAVGKEKVASPQKKTLVFVGTVFSIAQGADELRPFIVRMEVEKVVSGEFSGGWFEFAVHSPSRSGLEEGHSYTVKAVWTGTGYEVDQYQWKGTARILPTGESDLLGELDNKALQTDGASRRR